jgi:predicted component of viral defense system (DUF524 family)
VQLREASSYRYSVDAPDVEVVRLEPSELFDADDETGKAGRLYTREYVGNVAITVADDRGQQLGETSLLIKASKLEHEHEYSKMLREIADYAAEAVLQGFAPSAARGAIVPTASARLLYQQFAILQARLADEELVQAIAEVIHRPHRGWVGEVEWRAPGRPLRASGDAARALTGPGPRVCATTLPSGLETLPRAIARHRAEETVDSPANRFVKFALEHWRELAARMGDILAQRGRVAYAVRGMSAVQRILDDLDDVLSEPIFRDVGRLEQLPTSNQVLLKREGYRQIFSTFALIESSLDLQVDLDDALNPSQRNVATLYEYWTFMKLTEVLGAACGDLDAPLKLFDDGGDGLSLGLKRGRKRQLHWTVTVAGRSLEVSVYYNRSFRTGGDDRSDGSWSRPMVPDASVLLRPITDRFRVADDRDLDIWLHFDAKYRLESAKAQFERVRDDIQEQTAIVDEAQERLGASRREDLLKMHAYRDAIRRSAGAYVLYPGTSKPIGFSEYVELIPGLGAFPLRPGDDSGPAALRRFIDDVFLHVADQATAEERNRYWQARIFSDPTPGSPRSAVSFLDRPPADTLVLIGYVRSDHHWRWIRSTGHYEVVAEGERGGLSVHAEELAAPLVLLSGHGEAAVFWRSGAWKLVDDDDIAALDHPDPPGARCMLCSLIPIPEQPSWLDQLPLTDYLAKSRTPGAPVSMRWSALIAGGPGPGRPLGVLPPLPATRASYRGQSGALHGSESEVPIGPAPAGQDEHGVSSDG